MAKRSSLTTVKSKVASLYFAFAIIIGYSIQLCNQIHFSSQKYPILKRSINISKLESDTKTISKMGGEGVT